MTAKCVSGEMYQQQLLAIPLAQRETAMLAAQKLRDAVASDFNHQI
jgi:hypothetical protein